MSRTVSAIMWGQRQTYIAYMYIYIYVAPACDCVSVYVAQACDCLWRLSYVGHRQHEGGGTPTCWQAHHEIMPRPASYWILHLLYWILAHCITFCVMVGRMGTPSVLHCKCILSQCNSNQHGAHFQQRLQMYWERIRMVWRQSFDPEIPECFEFWFSFVFCFVSPACLLVCLFVSVASTICGYPSYFPVRRRLTENTFGVRSGLHCGSIMESLPHNKSFKLQ